MPIDDAKLEAAAAAVAESPEEEAELLHFAKPTSMMTKEEQLVMFAKVLRDDKRAQQAHTEELKRYNDTLGRMAKNWTTVINHAIGCLNRISQAIIEAVKRPYVFVPAMGLIALLVLVVIGQGDRGMDIAESLIEKYAGVDIHGHAQIETEKE